MLLLTCVVPYRQEVCYEYLLPDPDVAPMVGLYPYVTALSSAYFHNSLWALMVVEGRRWLTRLARSPFFHQQVLSSWKRFLTAHS